MSAQGLDAEYERRWNEAVSEDPVLRLSALDLWARRLNELPSPILFTVSRQERLLGKWQRVMKASTLNCGCGERRWLLPEHSVPFYPPKNPAPITIGAGAQLALGAWGADTQQTQIQVSVQNGFIMTHMLPYSTLSHAELAALGVAALDNMEIETDEDGRMHVYGTKLSGVPFTQDPLDTLATAIADEQRPIDRSIGIRIEDTNEAVVWAVYQVTKVDLQADTIEVVVSDKVQIMDRSKRAHPHVCAL
jgi:hypothetical protein